MSRDPFDKPSTTRRLGTFVFITLLILTVYTIFQVVDEPDEVRCDPAIVDSCIEDPNNERGIIVRLILIYSQYY